MKSKDTIFILVIIGLSAQIAVLHYSDYSTRSGIGDILEIIKTQNEVDTIQLEIISMNSDRIRLLENQKTGTESEFNDADTSQVSRMCPIGEIIKVVRGTTTWDCIPDDTGTPPAETGWIKVVTVN